MTRPRATLLVALGGGARARGDRASARRAADDRLHRRRAGRRAVQRPGFVAEHEDVLALADIGVALLMFSIGLQFSLAELRTVGRADPGGHAGAGGADDGDRHRRPGWPSAGHSSRRSSSAAPCRSARRSCSSRSPARTRCRRPPTGAPRSASRSCRTWSPWCWSSPSRRSAAARTRASAACCVSVAVAIGFVALMVVAGSRLLPRLLGLIAGLRSRELFVIAVAVVAIGTAFAASALGVSVALGAFVAGLALADSDLTDSVLGEIVPLRELFSTFFFVSIGILLQPARDPRRLAGGAGPAADHHARQGGADRGPRAHRRPASVVGAARRRADRPERRVQLRARLDRPRARRGARRTRSAWRWAPSSSRS